VVVDGAVVMEVVVVMGLPVEMVEKDYLMNDHIRFTTYHQLDFDHQT